MSPSIVRTCPMRAMLVPLSTTLLNMIKLSQAAMPPRTRICGKSSPEPVLVDRAPVLDLRLDLIIELPLVWTAQRISGRSGYRFPWTISRVRNHSGTRPRAGTERARSVRHQTDVVPHEPPARAIRVRPRASEGPGHRRRHEGAPRSPAVEGHLCGPRTRGCPGGTALEGRRTPRPP